MKLEEKNIFLDDNKIKRIIYQIRNDLYIKDEELLRYINSITITFDEKVPNAWNLPFCPVFNKYILVIPHIYLLMQHLKSHHRIFIRY